MLFENYGQEVGGTLFFSQPKSWGPVSPGPYTVVAPMLVTGAQECEQVVKHSLPDRESIMISL